MKINVAITKRAINTYLQPDVTRHFNMIVAIYKIRYKKVPQFYGVFPFFAELGVTAPYVDMYSKSYFEVTKFRQIALQGNSIKILCHSTPVFSIHRNEQFSSPLILNVHIAAFNKPTKCSCTNEIFLCARSLAIFLLGIRSLACHVLLH